MGARKSGLLASTPLREVTQDGELIFMKSNGDKLKLALKDMTEEQDLWPVFVDLSRVPSEELKAAEDETNADPWQDGSWREKAGEMWKRAEQEQSDSESDDEAGPKKTVCYLPTKLN